MLTPKGSCGIPTGGGTRQGLDGFLLRATLPIPTNFSFMELTKDYFDQQISQLATQDDLLELATKSDLGAIRSDIAEVKALVQRIDKREDQDTRAVLRDIVDLNRRVSALERPATIH